MRVAVFAMVALGVAALCVRLGFWQLDRLGERRARNAAIEARAALPPLEDPGTLPRDSLLFRRVVLSGVFDFKHQLLEVGRSVKGVPAVYVVTPLQLGDGRAVLVERGWLPSPDAYTVDLAAASEPATALVGGVVLPTGEGRAPPQPSWPVTLRSVDPGALQGLFLYSLVPGVVRRASVPAGASQTLRSIPLPEPSDGPHLSYAVQWFCFAAVALGGMVAYVISERRGTRPTAADH